MDLLSNIKFYYDIEFELKTGGTFYYCVDEYTAKYVVKTACLSAADRFLVFMIANNTRCVAISMSEIARFRIHPAFEKGDPDYTDNYHALSWPGSDDEEIPTFPLSGLNVPDCLLYLKNGKGNRTVLSYGDMDPDELAGLDHELSGEADLRKFIKFNGITDSLDYISTESIVVLEADSNVLGITLPMQNPDH